MDNYIDDEIKRLIVEIITVIILFIIAVPICVNASNNYNEKKNNMQKYNNIVVDISDINSSKIVTINNYNNKKKTVNLILKTSKFYDVYMVKIDDEEYLLRDIVYSEDDNYYYFNLGSYEVKDKKDIDFNLELIGNEIYDDCISYSFLAEVENC